MTETREAETDHVPTLTVVDGRLHRRGRPHTLVAGSMHYFRIHPELWADRLDRLVALGVNTLDTYIPWNFHDVAPARTPAGDDNARQPPLTGLERTRPAPANAGPIGPTCDFTGSRDVTRYLRLAAERGLDAIVRPGPYVCAEWSNGGLPARVTAIPGIRPRTTDPRYLRAVSHWFDQVVPVIVRSQANRGGNVVAVQVENEYGSYSDDTAYMRWVADALTDRGITEMLYTADGARADMLAAGSVPGVIAAQTFGSNASKALALHRERATGEPFWCAEYWNGWFDHWGERHHVRPAPSAAEGLSDILDLGGCVSIYMAHGGTNFSLWAGANHDGERLQPTVTSYDSDAPIAEDGTLTPKFFALRDALATHTRPEAERHAVSAPSPPSIPIPPPPRMLEARTLPVVPGRPLLEVARGSAGIATHGPATFEQLGLDGGLALYRATPWLAPGPHPLAIHGLHDRATVIVDGAVVGSLEAGTDPNHLDIAGCGRHVELEILVENQGRINYGPLLGQGKGILGGVQIGPRLVTGWMQHPLDVDRWNATDLRRLASPVASGRPDTAARARPNMAARALHQPPPAAKPAAATVPAADPIAVTVPAADPTAATVPAADSPTAVTPDMTPVVGGLFHTAQLELSASDLTMPVGTGQNPPDAHLALPGFGKGFAWVNGFLLGRYWSRGPQRTLYVPGPLFRAGRNDIVILELEHAGTAIELVDTADLGPPETYIEQL